METELLDMALNTTIVLESVALTAAIPGDIVECGVYQGKSTLMIGRLLKNLGLKKIVYGLDSFEGFPSGKFKDTSESFVLDRVGKADLQDLIRLVPGYFPETVPALPVKKISVLFLDCDLYDSYMVCLEHLYPKVSKGGHIIFDEYYSPKYPGARKAVDKFFSEKPEKPILAAKYLPFNHYERWYTVKQ